MPPKEKKSSGYRSARYNLRKRGAQFRLRRVEPKRKDSKRNVLAKDRLEGRSPNLANFATPKILGNLIPAPTTCANSFFTRVPGEGSERGRLRPWYMRRHSSLQIPLSTIDTWGECSNSNDEGDYPSSATSSPPCDNSYISLIGRGYFSDPEPSPQTQRPLEKQYAELPTTHSPQSDSATRSLQCHLHQINQQKPPVIVERIFDAEAAVEANGDSGAAGLNDGAFYQNQHQSSQADGIETTGSVITFKEPLPAHTARHHRHATSLKLQTNGSSPLLVGCKYDMLPTPYPHFTFLRQLQRYVQPLPTTIEADSLGYDMLNCSDAEECFKTPNLSRMDDGNDPLSLGDSCSVVKVRR